MLTRLEGKATAKETDANENIMDTDRQNVGRMHRRRKDARSRVRKAKSRSDSGRTKKKKEEKIRLRQDISMQK